ncbi:MAG: hypothetical protein PWQ38_498 [Proteiniphilum sp.]|nr:hypothetical protein [Proteiniphilum sp.]
MDFIQKQVFTTMLHKVVSQFRQSMICKPNIVKTDI